MKYYRISWVEEIDCQAIVEADSEEEALANAKADYMAGSLEAEQKCPGGADRWESLGECDECGNDVEEEEEEEED